MKIANLKNEKVAKALSMEVDRILVQKTIKYIKKRNNANNRLAFNNAKYHLAKLDSIGEQDLSIEISKDKQWINPIIEELRYF